MNAKDDLVRVVRGDNAAALLRHGPRDPVTAVPPRQSAVLALFGERRDGGVIGSPGPEALEVVLTHRDGGLRHHAGEVSFPGGGVDTTDASVEAAALREAYEEAGILSGGVEVLGRLPELLIPVSNNLVTPVLGWWHTPAQTVADMREARAVFHVPVATLLDPEVRGTSVVTYRDRTYRGPAFRFDDDDGRRLVWGFTAIVLSEIFDAAGWTRDWDRSRTFEITR